jgi:hypothetical protein
VRLVALLLALVLAPLVAIWLVTNVFRPPPASERLDGVSVAITGFSTEDLDESRHRLRLTIDVTSPRNLDECLGFALDEPFAGRRLEPEAGACVRADAGVHSAALVFDQMTDADLDFPSHTLVWGIPGGRCGPIFEVLGVCVVEQAGTADFELPQRNPLPTFGPIGTLFPIFSFEPR